jgi:hypothetical protein
MKKINKLTKISALVLANTVYFGYTSFASAADNCNPDSPLGKVFKCGGVFGGTISLQSIITLVFQIILVAAILWVVWNIVRAGITIAGAKEDAEARQNGLKSIINAAIGLVVCLSAFAIVNTITDQLGVDPTTEIGLPCTGKSGDITKAGTINNSGDCQTVDGETLVK